MAAAVQCPNSLVAFFPADIYRSVGSSAVLPELLRAVDQEKLSTVQFLRNVAARLTSKSTADCDAAVANGITYGDVPLRVVGVEARSRLVYFRDCPTEVSDNAVHGFFASFGDVHSVSRSCHDAFPGLFDGNRLVKMTMTKDIPASVRVAGYDCCVWYRRQPAFCVICKKMGHCGKSCPLDGLCRCCRQPGHIARECRNAWSAARAASAAPSSLAASSAPPSAAPALPAVVPSSDVPLASGTVVAEVPSPATVPLSVLLSSAAWHRRLRSPTWILFQLLLVTIQSLLVMKRCVPVMKRFSGKPPSLPLPPPLLPMLLPPMLLGSSGSWC